MKSFVKIVNILFSFIYRWFPVEKNTVLFLSFGGQYNDNPKYISLSLHEKHPDFIIRWVVSDKCKEIIPDYIEKVYINSRLFRKYIWTSQFLIDNHSGIRSSVYKKNLLIENLMGHFMSSKKNNQYSISTWHGTPLKRIAMDEPNAAEVRYHINCDIMLSGSKFTTDCLKSCFKNKIKILEIGTPRNDLMFNNIIDINKLKEQLGLPLNKKIILYAPTFRNEISFSGVMQMQNFDYCKLGRTLNSKFGGSWCFVYRVHNLVLGIINDLSMKDTPELSFANGNLHDDMAEYLKCADILITDYSSCMFDYSLQLKPCFLYTPDLENYMNKERGFYLDIAQTPFSLSLTTDELLSNIENFDGLQYRKSVEEFNKNIGSIEDGCASDKVVRIIEKQIKND